jgi:hypothetical protein
MRKDRKATIRHDCTGFCTTPDTDLLIFPAIPAILRVLSGVCFTVIAVCTTRYFATPDFIDGVKASSASSSLPASFLLCLKTEELSQSLWPIQSDAGLA